MASTLVAVAESQRVLGLDERLKISVPYFLTKLIVKAYNVYCRILNFVCLLYLYDQTVTSEYSYT